MCDVLFVSRIFARVECGPGARAFAGAGHPAHFAPWLWQRNAHCVGAAAHRLAHRHPEFAGHRPPA